MNRWFAIWRRFSQWFTHVLMLGVAIVCLLGAAECWRIHAPVWMLATCAIASLTLFACEMVAYRKFRLKG